MSLASNTRATRKQAVEGGAFRAYGAGKREEGREKRAVQRGKRHSIEGGAFRAYGPAVGFGVEGCRVWGLGLRGAGSGVWGWVSRVMG